MHPERLNTVDIYQPSVPVWVGSRPDVICAGFKKDLKLPHPTWQAAMRIAFQFETVWCIREDNDLLLRDGGKVRITVVRTHNGEYLIGKDDPYQLGMDYSQQAKTFQAAIMQRAIDQATEARKD